MWWPFRKRKDHEPPALIEPPPCSHKWKDFPPYMMTSFDEGRGYFHLTIAEPYVCIYCKEVKEMTLEDIEYMDLTTKEALAIQKEYEERYHGFIMPQAKVMDLVNDEKLVDRQWLKYSDILRGRESDDRAANGSPSEEE